MIEIKVPRFFRVRLYWHASRDMLAFLHGCPEDPIQLSNRDMGKLKRMRTRKPSSGCLLLAAHFHNWEAMAAWLHRNNVPLLGSALPLQYAPAQRLLEILRRRQGIPTVSRRISPTALKHVGGGGSFGVLWDQHSPHTRETAPFFGHPVGLDPLPGLLVRHAQVRTYLTLFLPGGRIRLIDLGVPDPGKGAARLGKKYHRVLERVIRAYPAYWYGFLHGRFKEQVAYGNRGFVSRETTALTSN